ncbi:MAG: phosphoribosylformylglycinamidine cyclo-ligase [Thermoplasmata archaeon]|nr:phosphoribosylformylglycinamidine cyclo-ligase [Thermoplasmata archaeon]
MGRPGRRGLSYAGVGVDRAASAEGVRRLLSAVRYRAPSSSGRHVPLPGHYAGLLRIGRETVALTTDTIGTKGLLARELNRWEEVGEDVVAINVNDLAAVGARPGAIVDTISLNRPVPEVLAAIGRGIDRGIRKARCSLVGGETAIVPELVRGVDLGATALGFYPPGRRPITGQRIRPRDRLLGLPSSGVHANGLTLARRVGSSLSRGFLHRRSGATRTLGAELLTPTRCYVPAVEAIAKLSEVTGLAHISGGGVRNLSRLAPDVAFNLSRWPAPRGIFRFLGEAGNISPHEMFQTFNMGVGFVVACRPKGVGEILRRLARTGYADAMEVGSVGLGRGVHLPQLHLSYEGYG